MSRIKQTALLKAIAAPANPTTLEPGPAPRSSGVKSSLRYCCDAWERAFEAHLQGTNRSEIDKIIAAREAAPAFRNAMPRLAGSDGIRDFIACAAHGILIGAIPPEMSGQLLYAAQVALAADARQPKNVTPTPSPRKSPVLSLPVSSQPAQ
jgi:hypothetical protein